MVYRVVMIRHGESEWNQKNLFCGWVDANLSPKGFEEAKSAGVALKNAGFVFDIGFTSVLTRAKTTLKCVQDIIETIPQVEESWRLNERHYGGLTGLDKAETVEKYGEAQVQIWRRSFNTPPPPMNDDHPYYKEITQDPRFSIDNNGPTKEEFPRFESLELTIKRALPYWNDRIVPEIKAGKKVLIVAHGNSLRGIVKTLDQLSDDQIMALNLPTGIPFYYDLDENMKPIKSMQFLGDPETVRLAMEAVAAQGKAKK